jgi:hypothetical protein
MSSGEERDDGTLWEALAEQEAILLDPSTRTILRPSNLASALFAEARLESFFA